MLVDGLHRGLTARGWDDVRHSWGFVMGRLSAGPTSVNELATFLGVSKQAASKTIEHMEAHGLVHVSPHPDDGRRKMVETTGEGERFLRDVQEIYDEIEASWAEQIGPDDLERIWSRLVNLLS